MHAETEILKTVYLCSTLQTENCFNCLINRWVIPLDFNIPSTTQGCTNIFKLHIIFLLYSKSCIRANKIKSKLKNMCIYIVLDTTPFQYVKWCCLKLIEDICLFQESRNTLHTTCIHKQHSQRINLTGTAFLWSITGESKERINCKERDGRLYMYWVCKCTCKVRTCHCIQPSSMVGENSRVWHQKMVDKVRMNWERERG